MVKACAVADYELLSGAQAQRADVLRVFRAQRYLRSGYIPVIYKESDHIEQPFLIVLFVELRQNQSKKTGQCRFLLTFGAKQSILNEEKDGCGTV